MTQIHLLEKRVNGKLMIQSRYTKEARREYVAINNKIT